MEETTQVNPQNEPPRPERPFRNLPEPQPKPKKPLVIGMAIAAALLVLGLAAYFLLNKETTKQASSDGSSQTETEQPQEPKTSLRMLATGDWIAHDAINARAKTGSGYDYASMVAPMRPYFLASDVNFCNHATLAAGETYGITGYPVFNAPLEWIRDMKGLGCNVINTGTNHTNDKGQRPITAMLNEWDKQQVLAVAGANRSNEEQQKIRYFEVEGIKFALLSYSTYANLANPNPFSLNRFSPELYEPQMEQARAQADVVIVSMRWGTEYSPGINAQQETAAQTLANLGADIVLGHGPHVLEPVKRLPGLNGREAIVWYSLGNFLNAQLETEALTGCVATFDIDIASKKLTGSSCLPFYQHYEWTPQQKASEDLLARKNFQIMPLYNAAEFVAKSQLDTTVEEQMERIRGLVNTYTEILVWNADDL